MGKKCKWYLKHENYKILCVNEITTSIPLFRASLIQPFDFRCFEKNGYLQLLLRGYSSKTHIFTLTRQRIMILKFDQMHYGHVFKLPMRFWPIQL